MWPPHLYHFLHFLNGTCLKSFRIKPCKNIEPLNKTCSKHIQVDCGIWESTSSWCLFLHSSKRCWARFAGVNLAPQVCSRLSWRFITHCNELPLVKRPDFTQGGNITTQHVMLSRLSSSNAVSITSSHIIPTSVSPSQYTNVWTILAQSLFVNLSQIPLQAKPRIHPSTVLARTRVCQKTVTQWFFCPLDEFGLYPKSPKLLDTAKSPSTRPSQNDPPSFSIWRRWWTCGQTTEAVPYPA